MAKSKKAAQIVIHDQLQQGNQKEEVEDKTVDIIWPSANSRVSKTVLSTGRKRTSAPIPSWKMYENPFYEGILAAVQSGAVSGRDVSVSARKLAASFWGLPQEDRKSDDSSKNMTESDLPPHQIFVPNTQNLLLHPPSPSLSDCSLVSAKGSSIEPAVKTTDSIGRSVQVRSNVNALRSHVQKLLESPGENKDIQIRTPKNTQCVTMEAKRLNLTSLNISNELKHVAMGTSFAATLLMELDNVRTFAQGLEARYKASRKEIENLQKKFADERVAWQNKEQEKIRSATQAAKEEVEDEKRSKRRLELANRKLVKELADAIASLNKMSQELEKERKTRELMENICDELAREVTQDKAEMEELRHDSAMVREEVEEERKMLQVAEVLREERVQMKLADAQHELEERIAALNNLKNELELFLSYSISELGDGPCQPDFQKAESLLMALEALQLKKPSFLSENEDDRSSIVSCSTHPEICIRDSSQSSDVDKLAHHNAENFHQEQKVRPKVNKCKTWAKPTDNTKRNRPRAKLLRKGSFQDRHIAFIGKITSEKHTKLSHNSVAENEYGGSNASRSVSTLSDCEDRDLNVCEHPTSDQSENTSEPSTSQCSTGMYTQPVLSDDSPHSQPSSAKTNHEVSPSSATTVNEISFNSMDVKNPHITRGMKGSIEWPKSIRNNYLKTRQEIQNGKQNWKTIR